MRQSYSAYGLTLSLPFACPTLPVAGGDAMPLIRMEEGKVPRTLETPRHSTLEFDAEPGRYLFRGGPRSGRFLVEQGCRLRLQRNKHGEDGVLSFHFLHSVLAALLRQRGHLVLHGNAVAGPRGAIVLCGPSGAGKSTTMGALMSQGWTALSDDVTTLAFSASGSLEVLPGAPQVSLCLDAASRLMADADAHPRNPLQHDKITVAPHRLGGAMLSPIPLTRIVVLATADSHRVTHQVLNGTAKFSAIQDCVYGPIFPDEHPGYFSLFAAVGTHVPVHRIIRPRDDWTLDQIAELTCHG